MLERRVILSIATLFHNDTTTRVDTKLCKMQRSLLNVLFLPYRMDKISMFMHFWHPHKADLLQGSDFCKFWENIFFNILPLHILNSAFIPFRFVWGLRDASIPLKSEISTVSCPLWIVNNSQTGPNVWIIGLGMNDRLHYPCSQSWDASGMAGVRWVATGWTDANIRRLVWDSNSFYNSQHPPAQTMLLFTAKTKSRRKKASWLHETYICWTSYQLSTFVDKIW